MAISHIGRKMMAINIDWRWWEVQLTDLEDDNVIIRNVMSASVDRLELSEVDVDEAGRPVESAHFIESDVFVVVKTVTDEPTDAVKRALLILTPNVMGPREDFQCADLGC